MSEAYLPIPLHIPDINDKKYYLHFPNVTDTKNLEQLLMPSLPVWFTMLNGCPSVEIPSPK